MKLSVSIATRNNSSFSSFVNANKESYTLIGKFGVSSPLASDLHRVYFPSFLHLRLSHFSFVDENLRDNQAVNIHQLKSLDMNVRIGKYRDRVHR
jgi:hypothetical protein